ncbi:MAG: hypothetical protein NTX38_17680 [Methylobacter sp.]|jgi:hypothetical protein|nr:hypothetical protein [Methylobacter sp.]
MNIQSKIQIIKNRAAISAPDMAILLGRKHLAVLRAIDAIPAAHIREGMYLMVNDEVFITATGVSMLGLSRRHLLMRHRMILKLFDADDKFKAEYWEKFHAAMPPKIVVRLLSWLNNHRQTTVATMVLKICYRSKGFDPL